MFMQLLLVDGAINICWSKDLHFPLFFVLASLDTVSALMLSPLGTCFVKTRTDYISVQVVMLEKHWVLYLVFIIEVIYHEFKVGFAYHTACPDLYRKY